MEEQKKDYSPEIAKCAKCGKGVKDAYLHSYENKYYCGLDCYDVK